VQGDDIAPILRGLRSSEPELAWNEFLRVYSPVIVQVVRKFEQDADAVSDCFLFVCERLAEKRFRRLLRFEPKGPARFPTWLHAVVRNLCVDWHRQEFGRHRVFQSVAKLPPMEQEVFTLVHERGFSAEDAFHRLASRFSGLTREQVAFAVDRIEALLTPRQRWLLAVQRGGTASLEAGLPDGGPALELLDERPNPETQAATEEARRALRRAIGRLPPNEQILIRLRYEQDLTLEQIARLMGYADAQSADRRLRETLEQLRKELE
jgi:RNA polymerase sigma factor (sigma-70 family)